MMIRVVILVVVLLVDIGLSAEPQFSLPMVNDNAQGLKAVSIKGIANYKPGGSALILTLLVQGEPGLMPGAPGSSNPGANPTASPGSESSASTTPSTGSASPGSTTPSSGSASSGSTTPSSGSASSGSTTPTSPGGSGNSSEQEKKGLDMHNEFRNVHGSQPMKLNREMCDEAQAYAEKIAQSGNMQHSSKEERKGQGENLSMGCSSSKGGQTVNEAVTNWYNEVCDPGYPFGPRTSAGGAGHFTQVVWNDSVELGIGIAEGTKGKMKCSYIVGRYKPLGNFNTQNDDYNKNVKQGSFERSKYCSSIKSKKSKKSSIDLSKILKRK